MGTSKYPELNAITLDTQKKNSTWSFICNFFKIKILDLRDILFSLSIKHELNSGSSRCSSIGESVRLKYIEFVRLGVRFAPSTIFFLFIKKSISFILEITVQYKNIMILKFSISLFYILRIDIHDCLRCVYVF